MKMTEVQSFWRVDNLKFITEKHFPVLYNLHTFTNRRIKMKKIFCSLLIIPTLVLASPKIEIETNDQEGKDTVKIEYPDFDKWDKDLVMTPTINMLFLSRENKERKYLNCYEKFDLLVDKESLVVDSVDFSSKGSRSYLEDIFEKENKILTEIINKPKIYRELFSLVLTNKNLDVIANSSEIVLKVCDEVEEFTSEELSALKQGISKRIGVTK